jgi:hypothetical protein
MNYPEQLHIAKMTPTVGGMWIEYFDIADKRVKRRKAKQDHEDDQRRADCALIRQVARDYQSIICSRHFIGAAVYNIPEAFELLRDCINALSERGSQRKEFAQIPLFSDSIIELAASFILLSLDLLGEHKVIDPATGTKKLCQMLTRLCTEAKTRYEVVLYDDIKHAS